MSRPAPAPSLPARDGIVIALLLAAAAWLQRSSLGTPFFADDYVFLDQTWGRGLFRVLTAPDPLGNFLRPVSRQIYFWTLGAIGGGTPGIFHVANLALFLGALTLLFLIARRIAGPLAATVAASIVGLHYAADVPLRWASGSQDLLALFFALAAIVLHLAGRRNIAAVSYALALLSKETVLLTPVVAWTLEGATLKLAPAPASRAPAAGPRRARRKKEATPNRAWLAFPPAYHFVPMIVSFAAWAALWLMTRSSRPAAGATVQFDPRNVPAAAVHFLQSLFGAEWGADGPLSPRVWPPIVPVLLVIGAVVMVALTRSRSQAQLEAAAATSNRAALSATLVWTACGILPVTLVASMWSAYYYLFALCGAAIAIGILCTLAPAWRGWIAGAALVLMSTLSAHASARREFAMTSNPWATQSHVTRYYLERSQPLVRHLLDQLMQAYPGFPPRTTLFFGGVPPNAAWQAGDGALFRVAYHDTTLRSYFIAAFDRARAVRGPNHFFDVSTGDLIELWPGQIPYAPLALNLLLDERRDAARDAMSLELESRARTPEDAYLMAWLELDAGHRDAAARWLTSLGLPLDSDLSPEVAPVLHMITADHDTTRAISAMREAIRRHPSDPGAHALLADLLLSRQDPAGPVEAFAALALAPRHGSMWRRWAQLQLLTNRYRQARVSLDRYFDLSSEEAARDPEALAWRAQLARVRAGGELAQRGLHESLVGPAPRR
jgi:hypothetical protein